MLAMLLLRLVAVQWRMSSARVGEAQVVLDLVNAGVCALGMAWKITEVVEAQVSFERVAMTPLERI